MNPHRSSVSDAAIDNVTEYVQGIRPNIGQFAQQLLQVFFVGLTIGMQRNVVPALAESEFGVPAASFTLLMAFVVSFGFVKGAMNFVSGRVSEKVGRLSQTNAEPQGSFAAVLVQGRTRMPCES